MLFFIVPELLLWGCSHGSIKQNKALVDWSEREGTIADGILTLAALVGQLKPNAA
jgi:hypothetical protein